MKCSIDTNLVEIINEKMSKKKGALNAPFFNLAERTGLEPATSGVTGQHSNQLNYRS